MLKLELFDPNLNQLAEKLGTRYFDTLLPADWYEPPNQWRITNYLKTEILQKLLDYPESEQYQYLPLLSQIHKNRFALLDSVSLFKAEAVENSLASLELQCDTLLACESSLDTDKIIDMAKTLNTIKKLSSELSNKLESITAHNISMLEEILQVLHKEEMTEELDKLSPEAIKLLSSL